MPALRIIGDVHGQIEADDLFTRNARTYLEIIADAPCSVQIGDMGDGDSYRQLIAHVDPSRHRFFPGNHEHYTWFPPHCLGDFGAVTLGGVDFFFIRGAESTDREKLLRVGQQFGRTLWFEQEQLTDQEMTEAEKAYLQARPSIVLTHDAPTEIARYAWQNARKFGAPNPEATFRPSRTNAFLARLLEQHAPKLWLFGHHHRDWRYREDATEFVCVGELSHIDLDGDGGVEDL